MKKTIVLILILLPIVLIISISFAGRIFASYNHVYVEKVMFVDEFETDLGSDYILKVGKDDLKETKIKILPELASNKKVTYFSQDETICTISETGVVNGKNFGTTTIVVKTTDSQKTANLLVLVTNDYVSEVKLSVNELNLAINEIYELKAIVSPITALNKNVVWSSSNSNIVSVDVNGKITAKQNGVAIITVTTIDGGYFDECIITISEEHKLPLEFSLKPNKGDLYVTTNQTINLNDSILYNEEIIQLAQIKFKITSGSRYAEINADNILIINIDNKPITIVAYVENTAYQAETKIIWLASQL